MAIGRTFKEALQNALRSLEIGAHGLSGGRWGGREVPPREEIEGKLITPCAECIFCIRHAFRDGFDLDAVHQLTRIDRWFLQNIKEIVDYGGTTRRGGKPDRTGLTCGRHSLQTRLLTAAKVPGGNHHSGKIFRKIAGVH